MPLLLPDVRRIAAVVTALMAAAVFAQDGYEDALARRALDALGATVDPHPEGKRVRRIHIISEPIIGPEDPYPALLNHLHVTTRPEVIRRELLFEDGEPWDPERVAESERNLRGLFILAVVRILPVQTEEAGQVDALVVTRDLWSIRFNSAYNLVGSLLQYLRIRPTEQNLFGRGKQLSLDFELRLDTVAFGQEYVDLRLFGSRLALEERANLIFNRATSALEGSEGRLRLLRPLFSLETRWGFDVTLDWVVRRVRLFRGPDIWALPVPGGGTVPWVYDRRDLDLSAYYTRSWGSGFKLDASGGAGAYRREAGAPDGLNAAELEVVREEILPRSESAAWVGGRLRGFTPDYRVARDLQTFALSEDYQVGPSFRVDLRLARHLDRPEHFADVGAVGRYRVLGGGGGGALVTATVAARGRLCLETCDGRALVHRAFAAELAHVTPFVGPGRFAVRGVYQVLRYDLDNTRLLLGGGNGLRGTAPEVFSGTQVLLTNVEYRTRPIELKTLHLGLVLFWDAGAAWDEGPFGLTHTVGLGLRALFPQFDVEPLRIDFGYVLNGTNPVPAQRVSSAFGQVTRYRPKMLDQPLE